LIIYEDDTARNSIPKDAICITRNEFKSSSQLLIEFYYVTFFTVAI